MFNMALDYTWTRNINKLNNKSGTNSNLYRWCSIIKRNNGENLRWKNGNEEINDINTIITRLGKKMVHRKLKTRNYSFEEGELFEYVEMMFSKDGKINVEIKEKLMPQTHHSKQKNTKE